jgi:O-antigen ligase
MFNDFLPKTSFGAGIPDLDAFRIASYFLLLGSMFHWSIKKDIKLFNRWIFVLAIFYIIVFASVTWSNFSYDKNILRNLFDGSFIPFFIALLSINLFQKENNTKIYIQNIIIAASILALISVGQLALAISTGSSDMRAVGTFTNPNRMAIILVLSIPCLLHAKEHYLMPKFFIWFANISIVAGVICSVSRKGIITMILCFGLYQLLKKRYKQFLYLIIACFVVAVSLSSFTIISGRFETIEISSAFETKWKMTHAGLKMFVNDPVYGLGYEGYKDNYNKYFPFSSQRRYDAHNMFITALANYGIIGVAPFMAIFLLPLIRSYKTVRKKKDNDDHFSNMAIICLCSVVPFMINGWFQGGLFYSSVEISLFYSNVSLFMASSDK